MTIGLAGLALVLAACATSQASTPPPTASPSPTPLVPLEASWTDLDVTVELANGWTVRHCDGAAPLLCVRDGDRLLGDVELAEFAADEVAGDDVTLALRSHARNFLTSLRDDRAVGCPDFDFEPMDVVDTTFGGNPALRTGFVLRHADGRSVERVVIHVTFEDDRLWVANASAYADEDGCLPREQDFLPGTLEAFEPHLDALVAGTSLPQGQLP